VGTARPVLILFRLFLLLSVFVHPAFSFGLIPGSSKKSLLLQLEMVIFPAWMPFLSKQQHHNMERNSRYWLSTTKVTHRPHSYVILWQTPKGGHSALVLAMSSACAQNRCDSVHLWMLLWCWCWWLVHVGVFSPTKMTKILLHFCGWDENENELKRLWKINGYFCWGKVSNYTQFGTYVRKALMPFVAMNQHNLCVQSVILLVSVV